MLVSGLWDLVSVGIKQDDFGTFAMKRGSGLGPFVRKIVLLRYPRSRPEIGRFIPTETKSQSPEFVLNNNKLRTVACKYVHWE